MRDRRQRAQTRLRTAVQALPPRTRQAMLEGLRSQSIVIGAYTTRDGGVCPGLAAHRCGGRSDLGEFARAWDGVARPRRPRHATNDELALLEALLEASLSARPSPEPDPAEGHRMGSAPRRAPRLGRLGRASLVASGQPSRSDWNQTGRPDRERESA